jgi:hypothetical protein
MRVHTLTCYISWGYGGTKFHAQGIKLSPTGNGWGSKMRLWRIAIAMVGAIALGGCVSGTRVTNRQMTQFQKGVTKEDAVIAKLGRPDSTARAADGTITDVYDYARATPNAVDFVPFVGLLAGSATGTSNTVTFKFSADRVLRDYSSATSTQQVRTGLFQ